MEYDWLTDRKMKQVIFLTAQKKAEFKRFSNITAQQIKIIQFLLFQFDSFKTEPLILPKETDRQNGVNSGKIEHY